MIIMFCLSEMQHIGAKRQAVEDERVREMDAMFAEDHRANGNDSW